eukprot:TRINITY_DN2307_c0_g1_i2.p1 TRINITY_DN2307_c0_g1~~TRINITY_DN2307_c0_g1_i2.p1  ORF type:complete len:483 (-),score=47.13 TRINITY_DN2307_c0_g1_i2:130-1578(-)
MIKYSNKRLHSVLLGIGGSVLPSALPFAFISAAIGVGFYYLKFVVPLEEVPNAAASGFSFLVSFLLVFRTQQSYNRFWTGLTLMRGVKGQWLNGSSNLIAFCSSQPEKAQEVEKFQHLLVRLVSMMYCAALQQVCDKKGDMQFQHLDNASVDQSYLIFMSEQENKCEVILQWIQRLIVDNVSSGVLNVAPPICSRVFQELSIGIVSLQEAKNISEYPFPFPYAQILTITLILQTFLLPYYLALTCEGPIATASFTFVIMLCLWGINLVGVQIENPFGDDANDIPSAELAAEMNKSLTLLMHPKVQTPPPFRFVESDRLLESRVWGGSRKSMAVNLQRSMSARSDTERTDQRLSSDPSDAFYTEDMSPGETERVLSAGHVSTFDSTELAPPSQSRCDIGEEAKASCPRETPPKREVADLVGRSDVLSRQIGSHLIEIKFLLMDLSRIARSSKWAEPANQMLEQERTSETLREEQPVMYSARTT